jgi:hypothetical protein
MRFDLGQAAELISHANLPLIAATLLVFLIANFVVGWRWQFILSAEAPSPGSATLLKIVLVGLFFNQVGLGAALLLLGLVTFGAALAQWSEAGFGELGRGSAIRFVILSSTTLVLGAQILYGSFSLYLLDYRGMRCTRD